MKGLGWQSENQEDDSSPLCEAFGSWPLSRHATIDAAWTGTNACFAAVAVVWYTLVSFDDDDDDYYYYIFLVLIACSLSNFQRPFSPRAMRVVPFLRSKCSSEDPV